MDEIYLKEFTDSDIGKIYEMSKEDHLIQYLPDQEYQDLNEAKEVVEFLMGMYNQEINPLERPYVLGVYERKTGKIIGHVGLSNYKDRIEIGYAIEKKKLGKGYGKIAVMYMIKRIEEETNIKEIHGIVDKSNIASIKVLESNSFIKIKEENEKVIYKRNIK